VEQARCSLALRHAFCHCTDDVTQRSIQLVRCSLALRSAPCIMAQLRLDSATASQPIITARMEGLQCSGFDRK
jgi:hypothetical protein